MKEKFIGDLPRHDPLYGYLIDHIMPQMNGKLRNPSFRVFRLHSSNNGVYVYEEKTSQTRVVGKFFSSDENASKRVQQEFINLTLLRSRGLHKFPHHVVKPLAYNTALNNLLVEEYCTGTPLCHVIRRAIHHKKSEKLYHKLSSLAYFLATMHNKTAILDKVDFTSDYDYFSRLVSHVKRRHLLHNGDEETFLYLRDHWREQPRMWEDNQVLVHGDATPSNFLFGKDLNVTAIDLERMKYTDRVFDLGRIVGELQHYFLQNAGNKDSSEPFAEHFIREYSSHFPDRKCAFAAITARLPFQIAVTLLRIARNDWVDKDHASKLVHYAKRTLERP
ncbi:MAG: aminoglycoside phosphotransferase family protein [Chlamydiales bacterium]|nr:aminoglycoside phosphotransferase family protein [Chlamydiales bacterium]